MNFENCTALITGASVGIGAEFAQQLHAAGARVLLVARRAEHLQKLAAQLNTKRPQSAEYLVVDLSLDHKLNGVLGVDDLADYIRQSKIDILVNNAGRGSFGYFEKIPLDKEIEMVKLNVLATVKLAHAIIPQLKERRQGAIVGLSSIAGFQALPYMATYGGTKAFNLNHTLALRYELQPFNVRVLTVCPGPVETEFGGVARVPGTLTDGSRDDVRKVVRECMNALRKDNAVVVPCLRPKIMTLLSKFLPRGFCTRTTERILKPALDKSNG